MVAGRADDWCGQLVVKNTFISAIQDQHVPGPRRCASVPASLRLAAPGKGCEQSPSETWAELSTHCDESTEAEGSTLGDLYEQDEPCTGPARSPRAGADVPEGRLSAPLPKWLTGVAVMQLLAAEDSSTPGAQVSAAPPSTSRTPVWPRTRLNSQAQAWTPCQPVPAPVPPTVPGQGFIWISSPLPWLRRWQWRGVTLQRWRTCHPAVLAQP